MPTADQGESMPIVLYVVKKENVGLIPDDNRQIVLATVIEFSDVYPVEAMRAELREWCSLYGVELDSVTLVSKQGVAVDLSEDTD